MTTVDIHSHLLNPNLKADRLFDKVSIFLYAKDLGIQDTKAFFANPYEEYKKIFINNIKTSKYLKKAVVFPVDYKISANKIIHVDPTVCSSNDELYKFYKENSEYIIPFFSINPLRENAIELIEEYAQKGFKGAKFLQNYWDIDTNDDMLIPYYEKLKELNLPLIIHTGSEFTIESKKEFESISMLRLPLEIGVKTIAAHVGLGTFGLKNFFKNFSTKEENFPKEYHELLDMLRKHDNLYADVSATINPFRSRVLEHLSKQKDIESKLLFGTDYPVPFSPYFTYNISFKEKRELKKIENTYDRYILTLSKYFDIESSKIWSNYKDIIQIS
jgi:predicted TIM-barrel fold metal-dependent hydrolase